MLYREPNTVGGYLSPACGGEKITSTQFFLIDNGIMKWCAKGIVILYKIYKKQFESNFRFVAAVECSAKALTELLSADII